MSYELNPGGVTPNPTPQSPLLNPPTYLMTPAEVLVPALPPPGGGPCDNGGPIQSYLFFNGSEVANGARTLDYMRSAAAFGLNCFPKFEVSEGTPCWVQAYDAGGGPFVHPATDPAPWYDPAVPASGEFLGLLIEPDSQKSFFDGTSQRTVTPRLGGLGGAQLGPSRVQARAWNVKGWMIASTCQGMEWGRRWLENHLDGLGCDPCSLYQLQMRDSCPPCSDPTRVNEGLWFAYEAALTNGPTYESPTDDCCCAQEVSFTITVGNGYLYSGIEACASGFSPLAGFYEPVNTLLQPIFAASFDKAGSTDALSGGAAGGIVDETGGTVSITGSGAHHAFGLRIHKTNADDRASWTLRSGTAGNVTPANWPVGVGGRRLAGVFHLFTSSLPTEQSEIMSVISFGLDRFALSLDQNGHLRLCEMDSFSNFVQSGPAHPTTILAATDYRIEFWADQTGSTTSRYNARVNGVEFVSDLTISASTRDITEVALGALTQHSPGLYDLTFDDFVLFTSATTNTGSQRYPGDHRVAHTEPDTDASVPAGWTLVGAASAHAALTSLDDDTSYVSAIGTGAPLKVGLANLPALSGNESIVGYFVNGRIGGTQTTQTAQLTVKQADGGGTHTGGEFSPNAVWDAKLNGWTFGFGQPIGAFMPFAPDGSAWTKSALDDSVVTLTPNTSGGVEARVSYLSGEVAIHQGDVGCVPFDTWFCSVMGELCCNVPAPSFGVIGTIVTISAGTGVRNLTISTYDSCDPATRTLIDSLTVSAMPSGSFLVINSATRTITFTDADGTVSDGTPLISIPDGQGFPWLEIADCDPGRCVCANYGAFCTLDTTQEITIAIQQRVA